MFYLATIITDVPLRIGQGFFCPSPLSFKNLLYFVLGHFVLLERSVKIFQTFRILGLHAKALEESLTLGYNLT